MSNHIYTKCLWKHIQIHGFLKLSRLSKKTKVVWNVALIMSATFFTVVLYGFTYQKSFINLLGTDVTQRYTDYREGQSIAALKEFERSGDLEAVIDLLEDWNVFRKGDRAYPLKRKLLLLLAQQLDARERYDELQYWATVWVGLDDRDITAKAYYLQALCHDPERYREALDGLAREHRRFPLNKTLARFHADANEVAAVSEVGENIGG